MAPMTALNTEPIQTQGVGSSASILTKKKKKKPMPEPLPPGQQGTAPSAAILAPRKK